MAREHDLDGILHSIQQLEDSFNSRYLYHWVFFSTKPLSEGFRRVTSNATNATCIYEHIPEAAAALATRVALDGLSHSVFGPLTKNERTRQIHGGEGRRRSRRWDWGSIARADRLRDYDWFWRIEPGADFPHNLGFDVFRFMRDHNIAYGFTEMHVDKSKLNPLSRQIRNMMAQHPDLLHEEVNVSWLLDHPDAREAYAAPETIENQQTTLGQLGQGT